MASPETREFFDFLLSRKPLISCDFCMVDGCMTPAAWRFTLDRGQEATYYLCNDHCDEFGNYDVEAKSDE